MALPLLETKALKKYFKTSAGDLHAVDGINMTIYPGKTLGVVGESGCGKSTLGRVILRLLEPTTGDITFMGKSILELDRRKMREMRQRMQIIFQDPYSSLNPRLTVSQIIAEPIIVNRIFRSKRDINDRIRKLMDMVGLAERLYDAYPHELDGGRRQRIGIARALSVTPEFIVCDEPVSALDVSIQAQILNLLMDLQDELGLTYLFITHDLSVVKHISDEILVMYLGQCVEQASCDELFSNPLHPYTKALLSAIPVPSLETKKKKKQIIKGEVVSPINPRPGCRFASRCSWVKPECQSGEVLLGENVPQHYVACTLYVSGAK